MGLDASTMVGSVALVTDGVVEGEYTLKVKRTHSERLLPAVERVLEDAELTFRDVDAIAVAIGPGSFTGLRIALATAKGLAYAAGLPVIGVGTLDALAAPWRWFPGLIVPMIDARRGEVYAAIYRGGLKDHGMPGAPGGLEVVVEPVASPLTDLLRLVEGVDGAPVVVTGDGAVKHWQAIFAVLGDRAVLAPDAAAISRGSWVAELGKQKLDASGPDNVFQLSPLYLRPPEAEIKWERAKARSGGEIVHEQLATERQR